METTFQEANEVALAVLSHPKFHYKACYEDVSGRPTELNCTCPLKHVIKTLVEDVA